MSKRMIISDTQRARTWFLTFTPEEQKHKCPRYHDNTLCSLQNSCFGIWGARSGPLKWKCCLSVGHTQESVATREFTLHRKPRRYRPKLGTTLMFTMSISLCICYHGIFSFFRPDKKNTNIELIPTIYKHSPYTNINTNLRTTLGIEPPTSHPTYIYYNNNF